MDFTEAFGLWRDVTDEEDKTFCIQQLRLPYKFSNLDRALDVNPYASILIYDSKLEKSLPLNNPQGLKAKLLEALKRDLPTKAIVLKVDECLTTEDVDLLDGRATTNSECGFAGPDSRTGLLGLFLPSSESGTRVSVACKSAVNSRNVDLVNDVADRLADELGLNDCRANSGCKSTLLLFTAPFHPAAATLVYELRNRAKGEETTIWVGEVGDTLATANCYDGSPHRSTSEQVLVALRISGPSVDSWSVYVDLRLPRDEVERQLRELRTRLALRRRCTGLLCAPRESLYGGSLDVMRGVERIFPGVPFLGMFDGHEYTVSASRTHLRICKRDIHITDCSPADPPKLGVDKYHFLSVVIVTYD